MRYAVGLLFSIILMTAPCGAADSLGGQGAAKEGSTPAVDGPKLNFHETQWRQVLEQLAEQAGLSLQMDFEPPGKFSYHDPRSLTPEQALDLVHGVLLGRGITLIRRDRLLLVFRLADQLHWDLVPHVPRDRLDTLPANQIIFTTIPVHSILPKSVAEELEPMLSPRGQIAGLEAAGRIAIWDRVEVILNLKKLLEEIDPDTSGKGTVLRMFRLRHVAVQQVMPIIRDLFVTPPSGSLLAGLKDSIDFVKMGKQLGDSKMLDAFVPGFSLPGIVPDPPRQQRNTRIAQDEARNALLITAEPDVMAQVAQIVRELDVPTAESQEQTQIEFRGYQVGAGDAAELAKRIRQVCATLEGVTISSASGFILVRAPRAKQAEIADWLGKLALNRRLTVVLPVPDGRVGEAVETLGRLFPTTAAGEAPTFVVEPQSNRLIVRGSADQIEQVKQALEKLSNPRP